jgi:hypothetical protein
MPPRAIAAAAVAHASTHTAAASLAKQLFPAAAPLRRDLRLMAIWNLEMTWFPVIFPNTGTGS